MGKFDGLFDDVIPEEKKAEQPRTGKFDGLFDDEPPAVGRVQQGLEQAREPVAPEAPPPPPVPQAPSAPQEDGMIPGIEGMMDVTPADTSFRQQVKGRVRQAATFGAAPLHIVANAYYSQSGIEGEIDPTGNFYATKEPYNRYETPEYVEYDDIPGLLHPIVTKGVETVWKRNADLDGTIRDIDKTIGEMVDGTVDFVFDFLPATVDGGWKPKHVVGSKEYEGEQAGITEVMERKDDPVNIMMEAVGAGGAAISAKVGVLTNNNLLGQMSELAYWTAIGKAAHGGLKSGEVNHRGERIVTTNDGARNLLAMADLAKEKVEVLENKLGTEPIASVPTPSGGERITYRLETGEEFTVLKNKGMTEAEHSVHVREVADRITAHRESVNTIKERDKGVAQQKKAVEVALEAEEEVFNPEELPPRPKYHPDAPEVEVRPVEVEAPAKPARSLDVVNKEIASKSYELAKAREYYKNNKDKIDKVNLDKLIEDGKALAQEIKDLQTEKSYLKKKGASERAKVRSREEIIAKEGVAPFSETEAPPPPPTRQTSGGKVKGMATGRFRFNRGNIYDPEGRKIAARYSTKEGMKLIEKLNEEHNLTGFETEKNQKLKQLDLTIIRPDIDFRKTMYFAMKNGFLPSELITRMRQTYYNLPKARREAFKERYQNMIMHANALREQVKAEPDKWGRPKFSPEKPYLPKPEATKETTARAVAPTAKQEIVQDQILEHRPSRAKEKAPAPKKAEKPKHVKKAEGLAQPLNELIAEISKAIDLTEGKTEYDGMRGLLIMKLAEVKDALRRGANTVADMNDLKPGERPQPPNPFNELRKAVDTYAEKFVTPEGEKPKHVRKGTTKTIDGREAWWDGEMWVEGKVPVGYTRWRKTGKNFWRQHWDGEKWVKGKGSLDPSVVKKAKADAKLEAKMKAESEAFVKAMTPSEKTARAITEYDEQMAEQHAAWPDYEEQVAGAVDKVLASKKEKPVVRRKEKRSAKNVTDPELEKMAKDVFGDGNRADFMEQMKEGADVLPYPNEEGDFPNGQRMLAAVISPNGDLIVGTGSGVGHALIREYIPESEHGRYLTEKNDLQGMSDRHGRFISIRELSAAKADFRVAFERKFGPERVRHKEKVAPEQPSFGTEAEAVVSIAGLNWDKNAAWEWKGMAGDRQFAIYKKKGSDRVTFEVDGRAFSGQRSKKFIEAMMRGLEKDKAVGPLNNESGSAQIINDIAKDITKGIEEAESYYQKVKQRTIQTLAPHKWKEKGQRAYAKLTAGIIAEQNARLDMFREALGASYRALETELGKLPIDDQHAIIFAIEENNIGSLPSQKMQMMARGMERELAKKWEEVRKYNGMDTIIEHYFPHYWEDPITSGAAYVVGKRPVAGPGHFQRKRKIRTFREGLDRGLKPLSSNPVTQFLWKMNEMEKFLVGHKIFDEMQMRNILEFVPVKNDPLPGYRLLEDPIAQVGFFDKRKRTFIKQGSWSAPEPAARIFHNYLKPGLYQEGHLWYRSVRWMNELYNRVQLGLSPFHFFFTAGDAMFSELALAGMELQRGQYGAGLKRVGEAGLIAKKPISLYRKGKKFIDNMNENPVLGFLEDAAKTDPAAKSVLEQINAMQQAGGGISLDKYHQLNIRHKMRKNLRERQFARAALRSPFALVEYTSAVILEKWVPRVKVGLFLEEFASLKDYWEKNGIKPTDLEAREALQEIWTNMDNRLGQVRYDNLHVNKKLKDMMLVTNRAYGWNLGTIRELGGSVTDIGTHTARRLVGSEKAQFRTELSRLGKDTLLSRKTTYALGLMVGSAYLNTALQLAMTAYNGQVMVPGYNEKGEFDAGLLIWDLLFPRTGKKNWDGTWKRRWFPSYIKEIYHAGEPVQTALNKVSPTIRIIMDLAANRQFSGQFVRDPRHGILEGALDYGKYFVDQMTPISVKNYQQSRAKGASIPEAMLLPPAPASAGRPPGLNKANEIIGRKLNKVPKTKEEISRQHATAKYKAGYHNNDPKMMREAILEGQLTEEQQQKAKDAVTNPQNLVEKIKRFSPYQQVEVLAAASPKEKREIFEQVLKAVEGSKQISDRERYKLLYQIRDIMRELNPSSAGGIRG